MNLSLLILQVLDESDGFLVPQDTICAHVRLRGRRETNSEIARELSKLDAGGDAIGVRNADAPGGAKWKITAQGKVRLMEAGI